MNTPKVVVIGAGSYFFARPVIRNMVNSPVLRGGTLALVDTQPRVLETVMGVARRAAEATGAPLAIEGATDRNEVLPGADFVVLTFSDRNAYFRGVDSDISNRHGIRMCSADTIGPGGVFRALREIPIALEIAADVERLAPEAWVINFVNPVHRARHRPRPLTRRRYAASRSATARTSRTTACACSSAWASCRRTPWRCRWRWSRSWSSTSSA